MIQSFKKLSVKLVMIAKLLGRIDERERESELNQAALGSSETLQKGPDKVPVQN